MAQVDNAKAVSQSYWASTTNFWNKKENTTFEKVYKFVVALFLYIPAALGDLAVGAKNLVFGKGDQKQPEPKWYKKVTNFCTENTKWAGKKVWDNKYPVGGALLAIGATYGEYRFGYIRSALNYAISYIPSWSNSETTADTTNSTKTAKSV